MKEARATDPELLAAIAKAFPVTIHTNIPLASIKVPYKLPRWAVFVLLYHVVPVRPTR